MPQEIINIFGYGAAICTTVAFLPQFIKAYKHKHTKDISLSMYIIFILGIALWLTYGIFQMDWPIILANTVTIILAGGVLIMKIKYG